MVKLIMGKTVLIQARLPEKLVRDLDKLVKNGYYKNRTDAIEDAIRLLLERRLKLGVIGRLVGLYLSGKIVRKKVDPLEIVIEDENVRGDIIKVFGTDEVDKIIGILRRKNI